MAHDITATREFVEEKAREQSEALASHAVSNAHVSASDRARWDTGVKGEKGDKGDQGEKGDPLTWDDLTQE